VTKANILNMTYPAFIFIVAPYITGERSRGQHFVFLLIALLGAWLIVVPGKGFDLAGVNIGDMLALASGIVSAFALADLREASKYDTPGTILFYQMAFGTVAGAVLMISSFAVPKGAAILYVVITGFLSSAGQYFVTSGYRYISATLGSIVLGSGILFSALFGISIFNDPLTPRIIVGGLLILLALLGVSGIIDCRRKMP
jgi:drug/metabolite transporter (DMT)-like permease